MTLPSVASQVANSTGLRVCIKTVLDSVNDGSKYKRRGHIPWTSKLAHQALVGAQIANYATTGNTLQDVLGIPCNQVAVIDDVLFAWLELICVRIGTYSTGRWTHIFPDDGTQAADPKDTDARHFADEETFARKHGFAESLSLVILYDT